SPCRGCPPRDRGGHRRDAEPPVAARQGTGRPDAPVTFIERAAHRAPPIIAAFALPPAIPLLLPPLIRRTVRRYGIVDRPNARRVNTRPIPRAGGLAIAVGFLLVAVPFTILNESAHWVPTPLNIVPGDF